MTLICQVYQQNFTVFYLFSYTLILSKKFNTSENYNQTTLKCSRSGNLSHPQVRFQSLRTSANLVHDDWNLTLKWVKFADLVLVLVVGSIILSGRLILLIWRIRQV